MHPENKSVRGPPAQGRPKAVGFNAASPAASRRMVEIGVIARRLQGREILRHDPPVEPRKVTAEYTEPTESG